MCCSPTYNVTVTQIRVGTTLIDVDITALFDSGTSFTYVVEPTYTRLLENVSPLILFSFFLYPMLELSCLYFFCSSIHRYKINGASMIQESLLNIVMI